MKLIIAVIKPFKLEEVRDALAATGVQGMTVSEVRGFGRQKGQTEIYRGAEYTTAFVPKVRIELVVPEGQAGAAVEAIQQSAATGTIGAPVRTASRAGPVCPRWSRPSRARVPSG